MKETLDDEALAVKAQKELPYRFDAYTELYTRHHKRVFRSCYRMCRNTEEADSLTQDIWLKVYHHIGSYRNEAKFQTWLYTIIRNTCLTRLNKNQKRQRLLKELVEGCSQDKELHLTGQAEHRSEIVEQCFSEMSEKDQEILFARYFSDLSLEEISVLLEVSLSAVKMRLYRSMDKFKINYENKNKN